MNGAATRFLRLGASLSGLILLAWILTGQAAKPATHRVSLPTDWSHRHAIFSEPQTAEENARLADEPRYWQQLYRRQLPTAAVGLTPAAFKAAMHRDWSINLGTGASMGAGNYPAKFGFDVTKASCSDFVVFGTGILSNSGQAAIAGFTNLYSPGCAGSPTINWAYDTGGRVTTSPVLSLDGTQVAFVQDNGFLPASVVVLKWAASTTETITSPHPLTSSSCATAPCMTAIPLKDGTGIQTADTTSSLFYDYKSDTAWVGDFGGWLHKFTPFFKGTPTEVRTAPWPLRPNPAFPNTLSSPVFDRNSGNVFVGDLGGILYRVDPSTGGVTASAQLDFGAGLVDAPIIDVTKGLVYVFASNDGGASCGPLLTGPCAAVYQFSTNFTAGVTGPEVTVGASAASPNPMYIGGFDSAYFGSANRTGILYVCGNTGANPTLYQVPITAGALPASGLGTPFAPLAATGTAGCSSVTDIPNPNTTGGASERIFVSVQNNGLATPCSISGGCIFNFVVAPWKPSTVYTVGQQVLAPNRRLETVMSVTLDNKSGTTTPSWTGANGTTTPDNHVTRITNGILTASPIGAWVANHNYSSAIGRILDTNGNVEVSTTPGTSALAGPPTFPTAPGSTLLDGTVTWTNSGPVGTFALPASGGTSGIMYDNVSVGTLAGTSQVYFTTLSDQTCTTSGTSGGCAVQASQPALK